MRRVPWISLLVLFLAHVAVGQAVPVLYYSDLPTGMCTGGKDNRGHIVTINGKNFGNAPDAGHYVTIAGAQAAAYLLWQDDKIAFQPGCAVADGDYTITVTTPAGTSNKLPFHIYSGGTIYFADNVAGHSGSDSNSGTSPAAPFLTLSKCRSMATAAPGNTCYLMPGFVQKGLDNGFGACGLPSHLGLCNAHGDANRYIGIVGYPTSDSSQVPVVGCDYLGAGAPDCPTSAYRAIFFYGSTADTSYIAVANLRTYGTGGVPSIGVGQQAYPVHHIRLVNIEGSAKDLDFILYIQIYEATYTKLYGIYLHDIYDSHMSKHVGGIYVGAGTHDTDIGWSKIDYSCVYNTLNPCITNKMIELHGTTAGGNIPAPLLGQPTAASGGSLGPGTYDVKLTYRSHKYYPDPRVEVATETTASAPKPVTLDGTTNQNAILVPAPAGYDHYPQLDDGVTTLCNPALAYKVYICKRTDASTPCTASGFYYQGEAAYSAPTAPGTSSAPAYRQTSALNVSGPIPPISNSTVTTGCLVGSVDIHDSMFIDPPGYAWPIDSTRGTGTYRWYNNVVINAGNGAAFDTVQANDLLATSCFNVLEYDNNPSETIAHAGGTLQFFNNTFYNCGSNLGSRKSSPGVFSYSWGITYGSSTPLLQIVLRNNIFVQPIAGVPWTSSTLANGPNFNISGSNNLCYNADGTNCPATWNSDGGGVALKNPLFVNAGTYTADPTGLGGAAYQNPNLALQASSPAIDAGYDLLGTVNRDVLGFLRPQNGRFDIGAYEFFAGLTTDVTPPTVSISSPSSGAAAGTISLAATCSDDLAVATLQFMLDGAAYGGVFTGAGLHTRALDANTLSSGTHTIEAICTDSSGNTAKAGPVTISTSDISPPQVSISSPAAGSTANGSVTFTATCTDNVSVNTMQFTLDGSPYGTLFTSGGTQSLTVSNLVLGTHVVGALCSDSSGNTANAATVTFTLSGSKGTTTSTVDFTITTLNGTPNTATVTAGSTASYSLGVKQTTTGNASVSLSCSGAPQGTTCTITPNPVALVGTTQQSVTVTISTVARPAGSLFWSSPNQLAYARTSGRELATLPFTLVPGVVLVFGAVERRRRWLRYALLASVVILLVISLAGCGAGSGSSSSGGGSSQPPVSKTYNPTGTAAGTYTVTITGTAGSVTHSLDLKLTVN